MIIKEELRWLRRYCFWSLKRCIFIHVPKAAGTSIHRAVYGQTLGHCRAREARKRFPGLFHRSLVFAIVRNPWDRLLSAYRFAKQGRTAQMGIRDPNLYQVSEFDSFERFLFEWLSVQDLNQADYIFRPQVEFVCGPGGSQIVDFVGRTETLTQDIVRVEEHLGQSLTVQNLNQTSDGHDYHDAYSNSDMIRLVEKIYMDDIKCFSYSF